MFPYVAICCLTVEAFGRTFGGGGHCIASFSEILVASQEYFCGRFKPFKQPMRYQWDPNISQWSIRISLRFCVRPQTKYRGRQRLMRFLHIGFSPRLTSFQVQSLKVCLQDDHCIPQYFATMPFQIFWGLVFPLAWFLLALKASFEELRGRNAEAERQRGHPQKEISGTCQVLVEDASSNKKWALYVYNLYTFYILWELPTFPEFPN